MRTNFRILRFRKYHGPNPEIKWLCDVRVGPVTIFGVKLLDTGKGIFCALPSEEFFSESAGRKLQRAVVHIGDDLRAEIYREILQRWERERSREELKFQSDGGERSCVK